MLEQLFDLRAHGTNVRTEVIAAARCILYCRSSRCCSSCATPR
ncbi:MAG: hypothetical protein ACRDL7_09895 [Gaiellaceae bacterium]